jgi:DNA repair protein RadA/Sms
VSKPKSLYTCTECGGTSPKWLGKCPSCEAWNTLVESVAESAGPKHRYQSLAGALPVATLGDIEASDVDRLPTGIDELDRVLGGGIVAGGVVLIGGDPQVDAVAAGAGRAVAQRARAVRDGRGVGCASRPSLAAAGSG